MADFPLEFPYPFGVTWINLFDSIDIDDNNIAIKKVRVRFYSSTTDFSFDTQPFSIVRSVEKNVETYTFSSGDVEILDKHKNADRLTMTWTLTNNSYNIVEYLNTIMDAQEHIDVTGLDDTNLNTSYYISDLNVEQTQGYNDKYDMSVTLERRFDRLY